jgi:membrane-associated phospholipid phosphatase
LVPAAPPWYVRAHGCVIDLSVAPSPAGLARVDALLGTSYFATFYSRAASVFGAMPSMHNAYPLLGLLTAWRRITWQTKPIHIIYFLLMFVASLYLDHHWIVDAVAGWVIAVVAVSVSPRLIMRFNVERASTTAVQPASAE